MKREIAAAVADVLRAHGIAEPETAARDPALARGMIDAAGMFGETEIAPRERRVRRAVYGHLRLDRSPRDAGRWSKCENVNRRMPWGFQNGPSGGALPPPDGLRLHRFRDQTPDVARIRMGFITNRMMKAAATSMAQESQNTVCQPPEYSATTLPSGTRSEATPFAVKIRP